jgi:anti-sigma factor RsiW
MTGEANGKPAANEAASAACVWADAVSAYLDGELEAGETFVFEAHLQTCATCPAALAEQRRLLGLITAAVSGPQEAVLLPRDFARVVTARAQSDMTSVRASSEKRRAALLVLALAAATTVLIGAGGWGEVFTPAATLARGLASAAEMALRAQGVAALFALAALACAVLVLLRLLTKHYRAARPD